MSLAIRGAPRSPASSLDAVQRQASLIVFPEAQVLVTRVVKMDALVESESAAAGKLDRFLRSLRATGVLACKVETTTRASRTESTDGILQQRAEIAAGTPDRLGTTHEMQGTWECCATVDHHDGPGEDQQHIETFAGIRRQDRFREELDRSRSIILPVGDLCRGVAGG